MLALIVGHWNSTLIREWREIHFFTGLPRKVKKELKPQDSQINSACISFATPKDMFCTPDISAWIFL